jgi:hypothetical protein
LQQSDVETYLDRVVWGSLSSSFPLSDFGKSGNLKKYRMFLPTASTLSPSFR